MTTPPKSIDETSSPENSASPPEIQVEFFGIARQLAGRESASVNALTIADVITALSSRFPELGSRCFIDQGLRPHWLFNVDGRFIRDTRALVTPDTPVLLMSADAGG